MGNYRLHIRRYQALVIWTAVGALVLMALVSFSARPASAGDHGVNSKAHGTAQQPEDKPLPRSPGVTGLTDPSAIKHPCPVYSFTGDEPESQPSVFPGGTFEGAGRVVVVGETWQTWNPQTAGLHLLFAFEGHYTVRFHTPVKAVVLKAEPNAFDTFPITVSGFDPQGRPLGSFSRSIVGNSGADYVGLASESRPIRSITISAPPEAVGFAFTDLTWGTSSCGRP